MRSRMVLLPRLVSHWREAFERPHRLMDQHFGRLMKQENLLNSYFDRRLPSINSRLWEDLIRDDFAHDLHQGERQGYSQITADKDKFYVSLDVQQFKPEEINVKVVDNFFVIEGKHGLIYKLYYYCLSRLYLFHSSLICYCNQDVRLCD